MASQNDRSQMLERFEARRKSCLKRWRISLSAIGVVLVGCEYGLYVAEIEGAGVYAIPPFFAVFAVAISYFLTTAGFKKDYKTSILGPLLESYGDGMSYDPERYIDPSVYETSGLFHKQVDRYRGEDFLSGSHQGVRFQLSELNTEYKTTNTSGTGSRTNWHTIFKGIFCVAELPEPLGIKEPVLVLPTTLENRVEAWGLRLEKSKYRRTERLAMEDPEFDKEFCVYGADPAEARRLLTRKLRKRILHYQQRVDNQLNLSFTDTTVYIAISSFKNYFEPRISASLKDPDTLKAYTDDLDLILEIIECVKG
jgi:hypothetical protein